MKLIRLHAENFGTLEDFDLDLSEGINVLYRKNGWGKSTLAVFIKAMLYGLPASSRRSLDENERKKYAPWQGGAYGGSLDFSCAKGTFRIERFFGAKETADTFALYDLSTNKPSTAFSANIGEELFGIDADGFERSTYLSQRSLTSGKENSSISAKLGNLLDDVGDIANFDIAMEALEKRRKYYTLTGNRGAIAELEQAALERQSELEACIRVREAMTVQEKELAECAAQIKETQKNAADIRVRLQKAGLAREHAALLEHKNKMLEELSILTADKKKNDAFFQNLPPSRGELAENQRLYENIKETAVRLDTIPEVSPDQELLERLRRRYPAERTAQLLMGLEKSNEYLLNLRSRTDALRATLEPDADMGRFSNGAPSDEALDKAAKVMDEAHKLRQSIDALNAAPDPAAKKSPLLPIGIGLTLLGVGSIVASLLFSLSTLSSSLFIVFFALGGAAFATGIVLAVVALRGARKNEQDSALLREKRAKKERAYADAIDHVRAFLDTYHMADDSDLTRALTELTLLSRQYRQSLEKHKQARHELEEIGRRRIETTERIRTAFRQLGRELPALPDYREPLNELRRETDRLEALEDAEVKRKNDRESLKKALADLKEQLLPFLHRYDPKKSMRAGECLELIAEKLNERNRLVHLCVEKERKLKEFIAEKNLDAISDNISAEDFQRLSAEEGELAVKLEELQHRYAQIKSTIDRLAIDADRVPELEEALEQIKERIREAKANAATIEHTKKLLEEAKESLSTRYLGGMQASFSKFLSTLIGMEAPEAMMDTSFDVRLREDGQTHTMESFSRGWRDAVQFCVRLSLTDALFEEGEKPFLLLDDPFVNLDDDRLAAARALLDELAAEYQILYFVCHKERV